MKGDFSRQTFERRKHYSGVLMQQGRVQLDADWNEMGDIVRHRTETEAVDVIGGCGAPMHAAGFKITTDGKTLRIGPGRYYVDGLLAEQDAGPITFEDQDKIALPGARMADVLARMREIGASAGLVYLDVWHRHLTVLDDERLREVALGGPDTTTRLKTVWQVKVMPIAGERWGVLVELIERRKEVEDELEVLQAAETEIRAEITALEVKRIRARPGSAEAKSLEKLVEKARAKEAEVRAAGEQRRTQREELSRKIRELEGASVAGACDARIPAWDALFEPGGRLNARALPDDPGHDPCLLAGAGGYRRLENQLYRVEIHKPGSLGTASFKWSRDNGSVVTAIERIQGSVVTVHDVGPDQALGFTHGQWVEITDDALELNGMPGRLAQIEAVDPATREITLSGAAPSPLASGPSGIDAARHPKLRRWDHVDQAGASVTAEGVMTGASWIPLEDGISVQFSAATYRTGDYWLIPARTATADLDWPPYETPNEHPEAQPRHGVHHHYCRLALIRVRDGAIDPRVTDCRKLFPSLTELTATEPEPALHVVETNWENDRPLDSSILAREGLRIALDGPPDPSSVSNETVVVTLEVPYVAGGQPHPLFRQIVVVPGQVGIDQADANTIVWRPGEPATGGAVLTSERAVRVPVTALLFARAVASEPIRMRVLLRGHVLWSRTERETRFLDGQSFGRPAVGQNNEAYTALSLPSGDGVRASDFESWLYLGGEAPRTPLQVETIVFKRVVPGEAEQISSAGTITYPRDQGKPVNFKPGELINVVDITFNRVVASEGIFKPTEPQSLILELIPVEGSARRQLGMLEVRGNRARFGAEDPDSWEEPGDYRLVVFGEDRNIGRAFRAADDESRLDGDYDNEPGRDLQLLVRVTG